MDRRRRRPRAARLQLGPAALLTRHAQAYLRAVAAEGRERRVAGCFDVFIRRDRPAPASSYAVPHDSAEPSAADVAELVAAFAAAGRVPRLEFLPAVAPAAERALVAAGFHVELRTSVMRCEPGGLTAVAPPPGVALEALDEHSHLEDADALARVQAEAFGEAHEPLRERPPWLGHFEAVLARAGGEPAGGGMALGIHHGTTELVGIAVGRRFRRRGIAAAVTAELARRAFASGARSAILTPGDPAASRVYARAGFRAFDELVHLRLG